MRLPIWALIGAAAVPGGALIGAAPAYAGPPFLSDDPDTTPNHQYEILLFGSGARTKACGQGMQGHKQLGSLCGWL